MSFVDKLLNVFNLGDDDYDDDDDLLDEDDYDEDDYDEKPSRISVLKNKAANEEKEYKPAKTAKNNILPYKKSGKAAMEVVVIKPTTIDDEREIADMLNSGRAVVLNLEGLNYELAQRIIDFTSGASYAIDGKLQKISNYIFIITPHSVDISGDFPDVLTEQGIDITTLGNNF